MNNKLRLRLGEQEVEMKFNLGTLRIIQSLSGENPFDTINNIKLMDPVHMHQFMCNAVHAGVRVNYNVEKSEIAQEQLDDVTFEEMTTFIGELVKIYFPNQEAAEKVEDTQTVDAG